MVSDYESSIADCLMRWRIGSENVGNEQIEWVVVQPKTECKN